MALGQSYRPYEEHLKASWRGVSLVAVAASPACLPARLGFSSSPPPPPPLISHRIPSATDLTQQRRRDGELLQTSISPPKTRIYRDRDEHTEEKTNKEGDKAEVEEEREEEAETETYGLLSVCF